MNRLALENVSHAYGSHEVVRNLSFELQPGEIACLLGASGCGKTTVLRLIAGFETPSGGTIRLGDALVGTPGHCLPPERRRIGMVFQDHALFPHLSVAGNVAFGLRADKAAVCQRVSEMLDLVGLPAAGARFPHELSGGQQQRVALARALAPQPHILLLDEPFSSLDVELRERLALDVRAILKAAGTTAIIVTHDQHEAFAVADTIGVMKDGSLEQWATPYDLYHRPATRYVADFVGQGSLLPGTVCDSRRIDTELGVLTGTIATECDGGSCARLDAGSPVDVLLRPDDVVHDDASPLRATIVGRVFRGAEFLYTLRLPSGVHVLSLVPSHHDHAPGESIGIRLDVEHVAAFAEAGPPSGGP